MLKPDVAQKQVEKWTIEDAEQKVVAKIAKAPAKLRPIAYRLFDRDEKGNQPDYDSWADRLVDQEEQKLALEGLGKGDRVKLFTLVFGPLATGIELTWQHLQNFPYQESYARRSFRAPHKPAASLDMRFNWLYRMANLCVNIQTDLQTPSWLAAWCPYLRHGYMGSECGRLFAAVIDGGGKEGAAVYQTLYESATNEHEIGCMGRHVTRGLLGASREDGWELMEKLLLAAQRQEGLRQVLLETVDEAHPKAFRRMLRIIIDEKLARFSAVARAVDVWLGMQWDSASVGTINETCENIYALLESDKARKQALQSGDAEQAFYGLWAIAFDDVEPSINAAAKLATHREPAHRFVAAYHLVQTALDEAQPTLVKLLDDDDLRVALFALGGVRGEASTASAAAGKRQTNLFATIERLFQRTPEKPKKLEQLVWPWTARETNRAEVAVHMVNCIGDLPPSRLIPYIQEFDPSNRASACRYLSALKKWDNETRASLVDLIGDVSADVRRVAMEAFAKKPLTPEEAERVEGYLTRQASDLRQGAVRLLLAQKDAPAMSSAQRLTSSKQANQRFAGLELLKELAEADRQRDKCLDIARAFQANQKKLNTNEEALLKTTLATGDEKITLDNGLGLFDPAKRSPRFTPKKQKAQAITSATLKLIKSLDDLVHEHRDTPVTIRNWGNESEQPVGGIGWGFPTPEWEIPTKEQLDSLPLADTWTIWLNDRPQTMRDSDGMELARAYFLQELVGDWRWEDTQKWLKEKEFQPLQKFLVGTAKLPKVRYSQVVKSLLWWCMRLTIPKQGADVCHDVLETIFTLIPREANERLIALRNGEEEVQRWSSSAMEQPDWREVDFYDHWLQGPEGLLAAPGAKLTTAQRQRHWQLQRWLDEPVDGAKRKRPDFTSVQKAYDSGAATLADLQDQIIGPDTDRFWALSSYTAPRPREDVAEFLKPHPEVVAEIDRVRERILEIELGRGDLSTPASHPALSIESFYGTPTLIRILSALGNERFKQQRYYWNRSSGKAESLTGMVKACYPAAGETNAEFTKLIKAAVNGGAFTEDKVLHLAFLAPQWTQLVKGYYGWNGLDEGLYWFLAHMRYVSGGEEAALAAGVEDETPETDITADEEGDGQRRPPKLSAWERLVLERTPLSTEERSKGVVDVAWFHRTFDMLGRTKWEALAEASRFAASSAQSKRAKFIADVLLGNVEKAELVTAIRDRKLKDQVRLLGLLPLDSGAKRDKDLHDRYKILQEYKRYAKTLSSLSRPDAELAAEIGLQNLAQLAGYEDPLRLEWALEAEATQDLLKGPIVAKRGDVTLTLSLDHRAQPQLAVERAGKAIKSLPKTHKDEKAFVALSERNRELKRQASRVRASLEAAMCRGDVFTGSELAQIAMHALLKPMLERLVLIGEGIMGYPDKNGKVLRSHDGSLEPIKKNEKLRIAHPYDLLAAKEWDKWQHECFQAERMQPFKQVFRELYVVTGQEKADKTQSRRYAGQQVNPQQAYALWGQRGWKVDDGVFKVFHNEGLTVSVGFNYGITTPLDVEGLTIETVQFIDRDYELVKFDAVPQRIFSEAMRDLDLVVSVAHRGGVDPEASASTVEMRSTLLSETCDLLGIKNVKLNKSHATIKGFLSDYTVHLGSGVVHRLPGGAVCMVPVHAQHRGRLFLPFADDDPKTAEVISKTLLLAKDNEIQDPTILDQLRAAVV